MTLDRAKVLGWSFKDVRSSHSERDTMLYALGLGLSRDPLDEQELGFTASRDLKALPTMAAVIAEPRPWLREVGIDVTTALHASQAMHFDGTLPPAGTVRARFKVERLVDKGPGKGAFIVLLKEIFDDATGARLCRLPATIFVRGGGGFGGSPDGLSEAVTMPARTPDLTQDYPIDPRTALIYRLSGDHNPLHADPVIARAAGFEGPIVHGFCTFGIAGWLLIKALCGKDPRRLASIEARFSAPLYPGETLRLGIWQNGGEIYFEGRAVEREVLVLNGGLATLRP